LAQFLANPPGSGGLALSQQAQDAKGTINGTAFTSGTNTVATGVEGLTLKLAATGNTTLTVTPNPDQTAAITDFVAAYNTLQQDLIGLAQTYPGFGLTAPYLRSGLSAALTPGNPGSNGIASLADIGITGNANGTLSVNSETLRAAIGSKPEAVANLFSTPAGNGVADQVLAQVSGQGALSVTNLLQTATPNFTSGVVNSLFAQQQDLLTQYTSLGSLTSSLLSTSNLLTSILNGGTSTTSSSTLSGLNNLNTLTALGSLLNQQPDQALASLLFSL
ncbi:MAG: flagellar filament capping protein FliD, partial [Betaproteobacteria bacterium]|nr:flagellar filament capping protein FliD [Betaproteobacteria bacterium]